MSIGSRLRSTLGSSAKTNAVLGAALPLLSGCFAIGCLGTPTPLAPYLKGSVGLPHQGVQTEAVELARRGVGYRRYRPYGSAYWGQPELVRAIEESARAVHEQYRGGPPLVLGDLSGKHGGKIPRHNSHRSGRDVDLLWFVMSPGGRPVTSPGFIKVEADGLAHDPTSGDLYRLDVERQWAVIRAFLTSKHVQVQWMFASRAVEAILIEYARAKHEPDELIWRAQTVMLQPGDSLPHDDHIHLRISCTSETVLSGCTGGGPYWEWLGAPPALPELTDQDLEEIAQQDPIVVEPQLSKGAAAWRTSANE